MAWFSFVDGVGDAGVVRIGDPGLIVQARALIAGTTADSAQIGGTQLLGPSPSNFGWSVRFDPDTLFFFDVAAEVGVEQKRPGVSQLAFSEGGSTTKSTTPADDTIAATAVRTAGLRRRPSPTPVPTACSPAGRPSGVKPMGTLIAGWPVWLKVPV